MAAAGDQRIRWEDVDPADPYAPIPGIDEEFPGVIRWFELRRRASELRERTAMLVFERCPEGRVIDIPVAGADWPYGQPLEVKVLEEARERSGLQESEWRLFGIHEPPGMLVRIRKDGQGRAVAFIREVCRAAKHGEMLQREGGHGVPFAALCAHFAGRKMKVRWMGAFSPTGLMRTAPPDHVAWTMAGYTSSLVAALPAFAADPSLGDPLMDVVLDRTHTEQNEAGRERLDAVEEAVMALDPNLGLKVDASPGSPQWTICGIGHGGAPEDIREEAWREAQKAVDGMAAVPMAAPDPMQTQTHYQARIGHVLGATTAQLPLEASEEEVALHFASQHGLGLGHDRRVRRYAAAQMAGMGMDAWDLSLAVQRVASIPSDPCRAWRIDAAMKAAKDRALSRPAGG